jgi:hypothetical protein
MVQTHEVSPVLGTRDVRALAAFFVEQLGFSCDPEHGIYEGADASEGAVYAIVVRGDARFHLQIRRHDLWPPGGREDIEGDAYVFVDDAYALFGELTARGVPMHRPASKAPTYDMVDFVALTPEGHRICFGSPV